MEPFEPDVAESQQFIVISGHVTDKPGSHYVTVFRSEPYHSRNLSPVTGCIVVIHDESENVRIYREVSSGVYEVDLNRSFLAVGKCYSISVITPTDVEYRSDFDTLLACPPIDTCYYEINHNEEGNSGNPRSGIQFYNDLKGSENEAKCFRWILYETWEYHSPHLANSHFINGKIEPFDGNNIAVCYRTEPVKDLYISSTSSLSENRLNKNALNFVPGSSEKLAHQYSILVEQQSLSQQVFDFWNGIKTNTAEQVSLFDNQPVQITGNIYNVNDPLDPVLGCFYATQIHERRILLDRGSIPFIIQQSSCQLDTAHEIGFLNASQSAFFVYYTRLEHDEFNQLEEVDYYIYGPPECFDCRALGGDTIKPEFW